MLSNPYLKYFELAGVLVVCGIVAYITWQLATVRYDDLKLSDANVQIAAVTAATLKQQQADRNIQDQGRREGAAQQAINDRSLLITKGITTHVKATATCVTYGLVRVLNSAAFNNPTLLSDTSGKPDDACTPLTWRDVAADLSDDYKTCNANSKQLTDLQAAILELKRTIEGSATATK